MNDVEPRLAIVKIWSAEAARDNDVPLVTICGIGECVRETIKIWNEIDLVLLVAFFSTCTREMWMETEADSNSPQPSRASRRSLPRCCIRVGFLRALPPCPSTTTSGTLWLCDAQSYLRMRRAFQPLGEMRDRDLRVGG